MIQFLLSIFAAYFSASAMRIPAIFLAIFLPGELPWWYLTAGLSLFSTVAGLAFMYVASRVSNSMSLNKYIFPIGIFLALLNFLPHLLRAEGNNFIEQLVLLGATILGGLLYFGIREKKPVPNTPVKARPSTAGAAGKPAAPSHHPSI